MRTFASSAASGPITRAAASTPNVNSNSWTVPKISRALPATIAPAASSDMPVTISAPGSSTAIGASSVRSGPSSRSTSAAPKIRQPVAKAATTGSSVVSSGERVASSIRPATSSEHSSAAATFAGAGCRISAIPAPTGSSPAAAAQRGSRGGWARTARSAAIVASGSSSPL